ncbi:MULTISPECIES: hypothetical protein [unclassified Streptomyces]|uniref:hypothetical protein n=1 Tax=unclassified Streptomyces TaxID=2593676 RepID=UPI00381AA734
MPLGLGAAALPAYTADRLPRTGTVVRRAAAAARMATVSAPVGVAVRDTLIAAASRFGPGLVLRGMEGIADWHPPGRTYASRTPRP